MSSDGMEPSIFIQIVYLHFFFFWVKKDICKQNAWRVYKILCFAENVCWLFNGVHLLSFIFYMPCYWSLKNMSVADTSLQWRWGAAAISRSAPEQASLSGEQPNITFMICIFWHCFQSDHVRLLDCDMQCFHCDYESLSDCNTQN